jgi:hypothetical protein
MQFDNFVDDTLPLPADVARELFSKATDQVSAAEWLAELGIDPAPVLAAAGHVALVQCSFPWDAATERHGFVILDSEDPDSNWYLAVPVMLDGTFVDLLLIDTDDLAATRACGTARWLGLAEFGSTKTVRLHRDPIEWLAAGCIGICHIEPICRSAMKALRQFDRIVCNDVHTALDSWDWGFGGDDEELSRFAIDADEESLRLYFERQAKWMALAKLRHGAHHG